jgi:hypothetical protein
MNTVDPNVKVAQIAAPIEAEAAAAAPEVALRQESAGPAASGHSEQAEVKSNASLPTYHHHRSTALW